MKRETSERDEEDGRDEDDRERGTQIVETGQKRKTVGWMTREEEKRGIEKRWEENGEREKAIKYRYKEVRDPARSWGFLQSHAGTICAAVWGPNCSVSSSTKLYQLLSKAITPSRSQQPTVPTLCPEVLYLFVVLNAHADGVH